MVVSLPASILYGVLVPWRVADDALVEYRAFSKVLIGASFSWRSENGDQFEKISRTYLLIPRSLSFPNTVTVTSTNGKVDVASSYARTIGVLFAYVLAVLGSWWFWLRPPKQVSAV